MAYLTLKRQRRPRSGLGGLGAVDPMALKVAARQLTDRGLSQPEVAAALQRTIPGVDRATAINAAAQAAVEARSEAPPQIYAAGAVIAPARSPGEALLQRRLAESIEDKVARLREEQRLASIRSDMNIERPDKIMPIQVPGSLTDKQQSDALMALAWQTKQERDSAETARGIKTAAGVGVVALIGVGVLYLIARNK